MDRDLLKDKFAGCILGLAIGDALGAPVDGMTPLQVMSKYHAPIDGYYSCKEKGMAPGQYTTETTAAVRVAQNIIAHGSLQTEGEFADKLPGWNPSWGAASFYTRSVPIALMAVAKEIMSADMVPVCKQLSIPMKITRPQVLALFVYADMIRELIRNADQYTRPYDLFDAESSLLGRIVLNCAKTEAKFGEEGIDNRLSERLDFVRRQLMKNCDLPRFLGLNGVLNDIQSVLAVAIFAYMSTPDDFGTICKLVSMGGPASTHGALIGALIGATIGSSLMPTEMKDEVQNGVRLEGLAIELLNKTSKEEQETQPEKAEEVNPDDEYHE